MFWVIGAVLVCGDPLIRYVERTRFQHTEDFSVDLFELGSMTRGFDGICAVEGVVGEGHVEEITADDLAEGVQTGFLVVEAGAIHLIVVDCDSHNVSAGVGCDGAHWPAHAAAHVQDSVSWAGLDEIHCHLLVEARGFMVGLAGDRGGEMEGLTPSPLIDVGH
ncbi:hypothetical protein V8G54_006917 [Vigna mungo]|uniref:Uncharacterized protein n=1 Tax=Vigna mungo TaxID=3915 RepID=A0AAQ3P0X7_VIGMU